MSLPPPGPDAIPEETARLARAICQEGTLYMRIRDQLGVIYENQSFVSLFSTRGQPGSGTVEARLGVHFSVHRRLDRSTSCRSRSTAQRLEVCACPRIERPRL